MIAESRLPTFLGDFGYAPASVASASPPPVERREYSSPPAASTGPSPSITPIEGLSPKEQRKLMQILSSPADEGEGDASTPQQQAIRARIRALMHELHQMDAAAGSPQPPPSLAGRADASSTPRQARRTVVDDEHISSSKNLARQSSRSPGARGTPSAGVRQSLRLENSFFYLLTQLRQYVLVDLAAMLADEWEAQQKPGCRSASATDFRSSIGSSSMIAPQAMAKIEVARREKELEWKLCWHRACDDDETTWKATERDFASRWSKLTSNYAKVLRPELVNQRVLLEKQRDLLVELTAIAPLHLQRDPNIRPHGEELQQEEGSGSQDWLRHNVKVSLAEERFSTHRRQLLKRAQEGYFPPAALSRLLGQSSHQPRLETNSRSSPLRGTFQVETAPSRSLPGASEFFLRRSSPSGGGRQSRGGSSASPPRSTAFLVSSTSPRTSSQTGSGASPSGQSYTDNFRKLRGLESESAALIREKGPRWS